MTTAEATQLLRVGTRSSPMALAQVTRLRAELAVQQPGLLVEVQAMTTSGDRWQGDLAVLGGKGAFTKEVDAALIEGHVDVVVHCLKDVPGDRPLPAGTTFAGFMKRDDARDAVVHPAGTKLADLPEGSVIGTSSVRRVAQLSRTYPHLRTQPIRGNANSRLAKLDNGDFDALILAMSGLQRIGAADRVSEILSLEAMCPAVGSGVLALQIREDDENVRALLTGVLDSDSFACSSAERSLLRALNGHCNSPIAAYSDRRGEQLHLRGIVYSQDGETALEARGSAGLESATTLGAEVARQLLDQGAGRLIADQH